MAVLKLVSCLTLALLQQIVRGQASYDVSYDFIIVGGGIGGLVTANRLSELEHVTVLVIEAGDSALNNGRSSYPDRGGGTMFNTSLDWDYESTPQHYTGRNEVEVLPSGRGIGGSSLINGLVYTRAERAQIDSWEELDNGGWNWDSLFAYYRKSERLQQPGDRQVQGGATYEPQYHGYDGNVNVGWADSLQSGDYHISAAAAFQELGVPKSPDVNGGHMRGFNIFPKTITTSGDTRSDAGRSYYYPYQHRQNLFMMANTQGIRILWNETSAAIDAVAGGVEVLGSDGQKHNITARMEVIVSCGSYRSPPFLELSGIGNPAILSKYGLATKVNLPGVGENLMDQTEGRLVFSAQTNKSSSYNGSSEAVAFLNIQDLLGAENAKSFARETYMQLPDWASKIAAQNNNATSQADLLRLLHMQHNLIFETGITMMELLQNSGSGNNGIKEAGSPSIGCELWTSLPFARGNVHIKSADPTIYPSINSNFFMFHYDIFTQASAAIFVRKLYATEAFSAIVTKEAFPGLDRVPANASSDTWGTWLKSDFRTAYHPVGTCNMMPRSMGGVVNNRTRVYGTANVRVVDASIFPFQVNGHPSATVYAIAEKAADLIKEDHKWETKPLEGRKER